MKCTVNHLLACLKKVFISRHLETFTFNFTQIKKFAFDCSAVAATYADVIYENKFFFLFMEIEYGMLLILRKL